MSNFYIAKRTSGDYVAIDIGSVTHFEQKPALNRARERVSGAGAVPDTPESVLVYVGEYIEEIDSTFVEFVKGLAVFMGTDQHGAQKMAEKLEEG